MRNLQKRTSITPRDSRIIESYFRDIARIPLLTAEEEVELAGRISAGDKAALDRLVTGNLRFVITVSKQYLHSGLELADLISAGNMGLISAARKFDASLGYRFCSFASWCIRQSILMAIAKERHLMSIPTNKMALLARFSRENARLEQILGRTPSIGELTEWLNESDERIGQLLCGTAKTVSLDDVLPGDDDMTRADTIADTDAPRPDEALGHESLHADIEAFLAHLPYKERMVVKMSFGIDRPHALSADEIASQMSLSSERVRQIRNSAIERLQRNSYRELLRVYI